MVNYKTTLTLILFISFLLSPAPIQAQQDLKYKKRIRQLAGTTLKDIRFEGTRAKTVSGKGQVQLLSVLIETHKEITKWPKNINLAFYLSDKDESEKVEITIRELDYKFGYWMDKIDPAISWMKKKENVFSWPTNVLRRIHPSFAPTDLGVLVRLGSNAPSLVEHVAPAIIFEEGTPPTVSAYIFSLESPRDVDLVEWSVYKGRTAEGPPVKKGLRQSVFGNSSFNIVWEPKKTDTAGIYTLVVDLIFDGDSEKLADSILLPKSVEQTVHFYHHPRIP